MIVVEISGIWYGYTQTLPVDASKTTKVNFVVPKGQSITAIGQHLKNVGLIRNVTAFRFIIWQQRLEKKIQAGDFFLSPSMNTAQIAQGLTMGTSDVWIKVLEGWRVEEIADMLADAKLEQFDKQEFLSLAKDDEGYLFPNSYLIPKSSTAESIHTLLSDEFDKKVTTGLSKDIDASGKSLKDIITLASLVQREAREPDQMRVVAGILQNRLKMGMPLQVDATLQYIHGYDSAEKSWWVAPLLAQKESTSAFNTYKNPGLPPRPIDSPGLAAITAVLHPQASDYLYYVTDRTGNMHYAKTLEQHNMFVQQYLR